MSDERRAPVHGDDGWYLSRYRDLRKPPGTIAWSEHEEAWSVYAKRYGQSQSAERLAQRGGFGYGELTDLLGHAPTTWEPKAAPPGAGNR